MKKSACPTCHSLLSDYSVDTNCTFNMCSNIDCTYPFETPNLSKHFHHDTTLTSIRKKPKRKRHHHKKKSQQPDWLTDLCRQGKNESNQRAGTNPCTLTQNDNSNIFNHNLVDVFTTQDATIPQTRQQSPNSDGSSTMELEMLLSPPDSAAAPSSLKGVLDSSCWMNNTQSAAVDLNNLFSVPPSTAQSETADQQEVSSILENLFGPSATTL